jgi:glycerophosphoryl diester phosphodiesterase
MPTIQAEQPVFGVVAHEGGRGLYPGDSLAAFRHALDLGVTALDVDVAFTQESGTRGVPGFNAGSVVAWNELTIDPARCSGRYAGRPLKDITFADVYSMVCEGASPRFPQQQTVPDNKIALLEQVFDLVDMVDKNPPVKFNIRIRTEPGNAFSVTPEHAAAAVLDQIAKDKRQKQVQIESFDWRVLELIKKQEPQIPIVALYDEKTFISGSPWLGSVDYDAVGGDPVKAAQRLGAAIISPCYTTAGCASGSSPSPGAPLIGKSLVDKAHAAGIAVVPWTVNDKEAMAGLIDLGVDGIVTDYPDRLREVLTSKGRQVPGKYTGPVPKTLELLPDVPASGS